MTSQESIITEKDQSDILGERIDLITTSLSRPYFSKILKKLTQKNKENASILCDYFEAEQIEFNIKDSTKEVKIKVLVWLSNFFGDTLTFREMKKHDILNYLDKLRKTTTDDPTQKWIGSYNGRQIILNKFFRWLYNAEESDHRRRITPPCMQGIRRLPRKQFTPYKSSDVWQSIEHSTFLRYCPSKRDRCYHAMAADTSARPNEILSLRLKDIRFCVTEEGNQYAEVRINRGKTGPRTVPLIDSIPYLKEYLQDEHPASSNPNAWLFVSLGNNHGSKLTYEGLSSHYEYYKKKYFPSLLHNETVPEPDKSLIRNMLIKPFNLYIFRHSALTEKSQVLTEAVLRSHAGWTMNSNMPRVYIHLNDESTKILLEKKGLITRGSNQANDLLKPRVCVNCSEPNRRDSKFCAHCRMVLCYDSYKQTVDTQKEKENKLSNIEQQLSSMQTQLNDIAAKMIMQGLYSSNKKSP